jgi:urea ABC transporter permease protein UrtC
MSRPETPPAAAVRTRLLGNDRATTLTALAALGAVAAAMPFLLGDYYLGLLATAIVYAIAAASLDLVWGYTGIPDLGHSLWFAFGTLGVGVLTTKVASSGLVTGSYPGLGRHLVGLLLGVGLAMVVAAVVGLFAFFQQGAGPLYVAIVTLALSVVAMTVYGQLPGLTGGDNGLFGFAYPGFSIATWYAIGVVSLILVAGASLVVVRSDFGLLMRAIRDDERRIRFFGRNVELVKLCVFVGGAGVAAAAGGLYGMMFGFVSAPFFGFLFSTDMLVWVAVGGRGTIVGPILGAIVLSFVQSKLSASYPQEWTLFVGLLFVAVVVFIPDGLLPPLARLYRRLVHGAPEPRAERRLVPSEQRHRLGGERGAPVARIDAVEFSYGNLRVLRGVDAEILRGELLCIVGPNGAGKSTLVNVMTDGRLDGSGSISYAVRGEEFRARRRPSSEIAKRGVVRKFQVPELFSSLTVAETILLASSAGRLPSLRRRTRDVPVSRPVLDIVDATGLTARENALMPSLAHGLKQGLELAATVSMDPEILLLDEPTAGLTENERHVIGDILRRMVGAGMTIVLIEHDLDFVAAVADRVIVLHGGKVAASGTPAEVAESQVVREAYVGSAVR